MIEYNEKLITALGLDKLVDDYELKYENYNKAIFYALSAVDKHFFKRQTKKITTNNLLLGDYYSFEYYDLLKNDREKLTLLTKVMAENYVTLLVEKNIVNFICNLVLLLFEFYNKTFNNEDAEILKEKIKLHYDIN